MNERLQILRDYFPTAVFTGNALVFGMLLVKQHGLKPILHDYVKNVTEHGQDGRGTLCSILHN